MPLSDMQKSLCENHEFDFTDLSAVIFNCTLKPTPELSHTDRLIDIPKAIFKASGIPVEVICPVDHHIAYGVQPDMAEHGASRDDWPSIWPKVKAADILILATPIWLGEESSACRLVIERLYGMSGLRNDQGQSLFYGRTGGALITGNEDGIKHCAMTILYALQHLWLCHPAAGRCGLDRRSGSRPQLR